MVILYHDAVIRLACGGILDRFEGDRRSSSLMNDAVTHSVRAATQLRSSTGKHETRSRSSPHVEREPGVVGTVGA